MRFLAVLLCVCMLFGLCACGESKTETSSFGSSLIENTGSQAVGDKNSSVNNIEQGSAVTPSNGDASSENSSTDNAASNVTTSSDTVSSSTASNNSTTSSNPSTGTTSSVTSSSVSSETVSSNSNTSSSQTSSTQTPPTTPEVTVVNNYGNTGFNIFNGGFVTGQGDWVYYINYSDNGYLYKMRADGTEKQKIISIAPTKSLNVVGDWVYFFYNDGSADYVYRVKTDGSKSYKRELPESYGGAVYVNGDYVNVDNMRLKADFTASTLIKKIVDATDVTFFKGRMYFHLDGYAHSSKLDGSDLTQLDEEGVYGLNKVMTDKYVIRYYKNTIDINSDFNYTTVYLRSGVFCKNFILENYELYCISTDYMITKDNINTGERQRYNVYATNISVVDNYIYYRNYDKANKLYRIKLDGTGDEAV